MNFLRDTYSTISFRGRLLLLLIGVSLVQALVAAYTFHTLQSKPVEQRVQAQLNAGIRAVAPVIDQELKSSARHLQALASDPKLQQALVRNDTAAATQLLESTAGAGAGDGTVSFSGDDAGAPAPAAPRTAYVVDADGQVIAGRRPTAPLIEEDGVTSAPLRRGARLIGTLHVPVVVDENFIDSRVAPYVGEGVTVFVADADYIATAAGVTPRPDSLEEGVHSYEIDGEQRYSLVQPVLQRGVLVGAGIPESVIVAQKRESQQSLIGFVFALVMLMVVMSYVITRSVGDVLRRYAGVTRELAGGDLTRRIPVTGNDEIATLSTSFNDMAEKLEDRMERLVDARARMARQLELFGEALANATSQGEMLNAVCGLAIESTNATHARFWTVDEDEGRFVHDACVGLRPNDAEPCGLERSVTVSGSPVVTDTAPYWMVVPAQSADRMVGLLTLVSTGEPFDASQCRIAERIGIQAAVAIENARMHEKLREQATRDGLTGLANHRSMQDSLRTMLGEAYDHRMPLGVALFDVDNFKKVNDTHGHQVGDVALKEIARVLNHCVGGAGLPARYGGEEFVVVMPGCDSSAACRIADRIREEIMEIRVPLEDGGELRITSSFGVANTDQYAGDVEQALLLNHADMALYRAKRTGKNRVELATPELVGGGMTEMSEAEKAALEARDRGESAPAVAEAA